MMLPKKLKERVEEESKRLGISEEEFIVEALSEYLKIDPEYRVCLLYTSPSPRDRG